MIVSVVCVICVISVASVAIAKMLWFGPKKTCDSCKYLKQKGNGWKYRCMCSEVYPREFRNAPSFCRFYERENREDENN